MKLGIGITTYKRPERMRLTVDAVRRHTITNHHLVITDDGSDDATPETLRALDCDFILGSHRGIAWNKNRALYYLKTIQACDVIILLEDDTFPIEDGWELPWLEAGLVLKHANFALQDGTGQEILYGAGSTSDPFIASNVSGQCSVFHREILDAVGYMDPRFTGYGYEHAEHTQRIIETGFGGFASGEGEQRLYFPFLIQSPLCVTEIRTELPLEEIARSGEIWLQFRYDPIYRAAWRNDAERAVFLAEIHASRDVLQGASTSNIWHRWVIVTDQDLHLRYNAQDCRIETTVAMPETPVIARCDGRSLDFILKLPDRDVFLIPSEAEDLHFTMQETACQKAGLSVLRGHRRALNLRLNGRPLSYREGENAPLMTMKPEGEHGAFLFLRYDLAAPRSSP